ncbi:MAG: hypothetical protein ACOC9T_01155 [Myxococcota bacterium]
MEPPSAREMNAAAFRVAVRLHRAGAITRTWFYEHMSVPELEAIS